jgi:hypothetical protein
MRGLRHFKIRGKLAPRYIGPFRILEQRGEIAHQLELPPQLSNVQWSNHTEEDATWEKEDQLKAEFSEIFSNLSESRGRDSS